MKLTPCQRKSTTFFVYLVSVRKLPPKAVRLFFDSKVPGNTLESFLKKNSLSLTDKNGYTKEQEAKLFPGEFFLFAMSINIGRNNLITVSDLQSSH